MSEHEAGSVRYRVAACACREECDTTLFFAAVDESLWLTVGLLTDPAEVADQLESLVDLGDDFAGLVELGVALFGTLIRGLALALRDFCEQNGAVTMSATFDGGATLSYSVGRGAVLLAAGHRLDIPETALDDVGLVPVEAS